MSRLLKRIDKLRKAIKENDNNINNETTTRYVLIDPVLRDLGWPLDDPTKIRYEEGEGGRWDYNLANRLLIEAKKLGGINTRHEEQLIDYLRKNKMKHGVLTDGDTWIKFTVQADNHDEDFRIKISSGTSVKIHKKLSDLDQEYVMSMIEPIKHGEPSSPPKPNPYNGTSISEFQPSGKLPVKLVCQDDKPVICNRWRDILIGVAAHLVDQKYVKESDCPMPPKLKNPLIITKISHLNKSKIAYRQIPHSRFYVNVNFSRVGIIKNAIKLIKNSKLSPQDFKISTV